MSHLRKLITLLVLVLPLGLSGCAEPLPDSPEPIVRATLQAIEEAAESRSVGDLMQHVSDDYADHEGRTKKDLSGIVRLYYLRNQRIHIFSQIISLEVSGNTATAQVYTAMAGRATDLETEQGRLKADTQTFSVVLGSPDNQRTWLVESVSWERGWQ